MDSWAEEESANREASQRAQDDFCRRLGMVGGDRVPMRPIRNRDGIYWKNQIPSGGALGQQKVGAGSKWLKILNASQGLTAEYDAGSYHRVILKANRWAGT